ncbi:MAG: hypothetical protein AcusKO_37110 [Acuticoccus sp.]
MTLVTVEATLAPGTLPDAFALLAREAAAVRRMTGCAHYAFFRSPDGEDIAIVQRWHTRDAFEAYRTSDAFARLGAGLKPMMSAPPTTTIARFEAPG